MTELKTHERTMPLVLVVDDDPDLRALAKMQLQGDFEVIQAASGAECFAMATDRTPDVILLDMMMPGMDGAEVLDRLTAEPTTRHIPVIFLSALSGTDDRAMGLDGGAVDFITKPADPREFLARVGAAARTSAVQEELRNAPVGDVVTGLPDRRAFELRIQQEAARARRMGSPLSVLLINIDGMSSINDSYGRAFGNELLRGAAKALVDTLRASDILFRYAGNEFAALLPDSEARAAYLAAERCREAVRKLHPDKSDISISVGVAESSVGRGIEDWMAKAEIALFRAKESGGNRSWRADDPRRHGLNPIALAEELSEREWSVLVHLADRRTEKEIAKRMGIQPGTVRSHKARIRRKLHIPPETRLSEFVRANFRDLVSRIGPLEGLDEKVNA
jgi:diguanylate cyclase (GGDEF)-like protein